MKRRLNYRPPSVLQAGSWAFALGRVLDHADEDPVVAAVRDTTPLRVLIANRDVDGVRENLEQALRLHRPFARLAGLPLGRARARIEAYRRAWEKKGAGKVYLAT